MALSGSATRQLVRAETIWLGHAGVHATLGTTGASRASSTHRHRVNNIQLVIANKLTKFVTDQSVKYLYCLRYHRCS